MEGQGDSGTGESRGRGWLPQVAAALVVWLMLVGLGLWGLSFGHHWDEAKHVGAVVRTLETGVPLPGEYLYP